MGRRDPDSDTNRALVKAVQARPKASARELAEAMGVEYTASFPVAVSRLKKELRARGQLTESGDVTIAELDRARQYVQDTGGFQRAIEVLTALKDLQVDNNHA